MDFDNPKVCGDTSIPNCFDKHVNTYIHITNTKRSKVGQGLRHHVSFFLLEKKSEKYKVFSFLRVRKQKITLFLQEKGGSNFKLPEVED